MHDDAQKTEVISGRIESISHLYGLINELKSFKRRLTTNVFLSEQALEDLIKEDGLEYEYVPGGYLNIFVREWDHLRLYFYLSDVRNYQVSRSEETVVCDLFFNREDEKNGELISAFEKEDFLRYAMYHRWLRTETVTDSMSDDQIVEGQAEGFYELLRGCFDIYSDYVPQPDLFADYMKDKIVYSAVDTDTGRLAGGLVVSEKGEVQTEEFVFTDPGFRAQGIASKLHRKWYESCGGSIRRFMAWIRDDNDASIDLHRKFAYEKQNMYKITMKRSGYGRSDIGNTEECR